MFCRSAIYAVLSLVSAVSLSAQSERERLIDSLSRPEISATGAMLKFDVTVMNAGTLDEESSPEEYEFRWTNVGETPVTVTNVTTTCGCAVPSFEKGPVQPGEKSSFRAAACRKRDSFIKAGMGFPLSDGKSVSEAEGSEIFRRSQGCGTDILPECR